MLLRLLPPGTERDAVGRARERLEWQIQASGALLSPSDGKARMTDTAAVLELLALWRAPGASELGVMRQQLEAAGVALDPPPDWRSWRSIEVAPAAADD